MLMHFVRRKRFRWYRMDSRESYLQTWALQELGLVRSGASQFASRVPTPCAAQPYEFPRSKSVVSTPVSLADAGLAALGNNERVGNLLGALRKFDNKYIAMP